ncbi:unnamed protein product [Parnassius mnemosyne]|uniref:unspecific monooxygenase n=1 Tax=Parnassius mnemosyne TaxID=213953 RepID=A0AAV1KE63_9NEOP
MLSLMLATTVLLLIICWPIARWYQVKSYWYNRGVPYLPPHPLMGSMTFLQKQNPAMWFRYLYANFRSPYVGIWLFWRPALVVQSPDIARRILVKDSAIFRNRFLNSGKTDPIGSLNIFTTNDPLWSSIRRRLTPVFTSSKLRNMYGFVSEKSNELVQRIKADMEKDGRANIKIIFTDYTTDVVGTASLGVSSDATITGGGALRAITKDFMHFSFYRGLCWSSIFFFPELVDIFRFSLFPKATTDYFRKIYHEVVAQRGGYEKSSIGNKDLLDALRKIKQDSIRDNEDISDDTLIAQAAVFLQGGFDTTSSILTYCVYELAHQPHLQKKLYDELKEAKEKNGNKELDSVALHGLIYIHCLMKETLRKYTPIGWLDRVATKDYKIDENLTITAGTPVYVNTTGMHYDANYFPDPKKFDPDRFLPENENHLKPFTYMPFGEGPRNCIGRTFAVQNFISALSTICFNYEILPAPNTPLPSEIEYEKKGLFLTPAENIYVVFIPRS